MTNRYSNYPPRIYIAGPMRGKPDFNYPAFDEASRMLSSLGWDTVNPAQLDRDAGIDLEKVDPIRPVPNRLLREVFKRDLSSLCDCDAIYLLPGSENSLGAVVECDLAKLLGLAIYEYRDQMSDIRRTTDNPR